MTPTVGELARRALTKAIETSEPSDSDQRDGLRAIALAVRAVLKQTWETRYPMTGTMTAWRDQILTGAILELDDESGDGTCDFSMETHVVPHLKTTRCVNWKPILAAAMRELEGK